MAGFGGKADREWLEPLTDEGHTGDEDADLGFSIGCHKGAHEWLNIYNPIPGYHYVWERKKPNDLRKAIQKGGQIVRSDDPEMTAAANASGGEDLANMLDSNAEYNELQLVRYSEDAMRKIRDRERKRAKDILGRPEEDFTESASGAEQSSEWNPRGVQTRFATKQHRLEFKAGDETQEQWSPDKGILE